MIFFSVIGLGIIVLIIHKILRWRYLSKVEKLFGAEGCSLSKHSTSSPLVFGPIIWPALHIIAANYHTTDATDKTGEAPEIYQINAKKFIESLPFMIPCGHCGYHFHDFLKTRDLDEDVRTKKNFIKFFVDAHNGVSEHLNKQLAKRNMPVKKIWTVKDANKAYYCMDTPNINIKNWEILKTEIDTQPDLWPQIQKNPYNYQKDMLSC